LNLEFEWREADLAETLALLERGEVDVAVAALSVTAEREEVLDFSHPYYVTGLAAAFGGQATHAWSETLRAFFSMEFLTAVGSLALVLLGAGFCLWLFERKANAAQFGHGDLKRGLGDGFWWSAVTMTTVGYGDKAPVTFGGRVVALVWMFVSLIIIASFTASIAASLTTNRLMSDGLRDRTLSEMSVGVLVNSAAEDFARNRGARVGTFETIDAALGALEAGELDAVVHDAPILKYAARRLGAEVEVGEKILVRDDYAFAFPDASPVRNDVNYALLTILLEPVWQNIKARYLGETGDL
jgi:ABC-type amino acid transport substrate-binding protein